MAYAVMQKELEPPTLEQLKQAFHGVPGLTEFDAFTLGKNACGILLRGVPLEEASAVQSGLAVQGVPTEVVDEATLPMLPQAQNLSQLKCAPEELIIYNSLNMPVTVEWNSILLIAAGKVTLQEFNQVRGSVVVTHIHPDGQVTLNTETAYKEKEERHDRFLLEIILRGAEQRFSVNAEKSLLLFNCLGDRKTRDVLQNFTLLIQDLAKYAPDVAINRGAYYLREGADHDFFYPSKTAFYSEIVWLLWQLSQSGSKDSER